MNKNITSAIFIATMIAVAPAAFAGDKEKKSGKKAVNEVNNSNIQVQFIGEENDYVYLKIELKQNSDKPASLRISDGFGEQLYSERIFTKNYSRLVKVSPSELKNMELVYSTAEGMSRKAYNLNVSTTKTTQLEEIAGQ